MEKAEILKMLKEFPNDRELGGKIRESLSKSIEYGILTKAYPNDEDLGKTVRVVFS
jgi:hypothetical protein